ncbi:WD40 repeat domain-containing protein [Synechococcus sp. RC10A2]|uniref:WD40 repeat domain-containing protein n=1 Tax=Synechococcus sp. RC10A2 TaxID=2964529 RepID=UPI0039C5C179
MLGIILQMDSWGHSSAVYRVAFSPDGAWLASGSWDRTIRIGCVSDGALLQTYDQETSTGVYSIIATAG